MNKRTIAKIENAVRKSRIAELANWYARFRPTVTTLRVYRDFAGLLLENRAAAESLRFEFIDPVDSRGQRRPDWERTVIRWKPVLSQQVFTLLPETQT
jgi:hypothetical protein